VNVSHVLAEEYVGLDEIDDGVWSVYFGPVLLGRFHERDFHIHGAHNRNKL
jgi:putative transposase